ncbi:hypothetical protein L1887_05628 [Cichorium endivia]|nr:hypothetical protein L1887_05628 [Cichorium endivia]
MGNFSNHHAREEDEGLGILAGIFPLFVITPGYDPERVREKVNEENWRICHPNGEACRFKPNSILISNVL